MSSVARNFATFAAMAGSATAALVIPSTRAAIISYHHSSPLAAASLYAGAAAFAALSYMLLKSPPEVYRHASVTGVASLLNNKEHRELVKKDQVKDAVEVYQSQFGEKSRTGDSEHDALISKRQKNYMTMVNHFYDLVTDFYEYGWSDCFHFGFRFTGETFMESLRRTEYYLCHRLGMGPGHLVADIGCGVGGPMRNMARFSGAKVVGINNNSYQIKVGSAHNKRWGLENQCSFKQSDFMHIDVPDATFDHAYAIEATCHAPDKAACYSEVNRILKKGGLFACYEWCVTPAYDPKNPRHVAIREGVECGNGLPVLASFKEVLAALDKAGFEVIESFNAQRDAHAGPQHTPWYATLRGEYSIEGFRMTPVGRLVTHMLVTVLETVGIAPKGSSKVSKFLKDTADDLVEGGKLEIFTPSFFFLARKK